MLVFGLGHLWRFHRDRLGWGRRSTQEFRNGLRTWEGPLFHYAALAAIAGHGLGILVPRQATEWLGVSDARFQLISSTVGSLLGMAAIAGLAMLAWQRLTIAPKRASTTGFDVAAYTTLFLVIGLGTWNTITYGLVGAGYDYRSSVAVWFRSVLLFHPNPNLMSAVPLSYQLHAVAAMTLFAMWPFTRLVHVWTMSAAFAVRLYDVQRRRIQS